MKLNSLMTFLKHYDFKALRVEVDQQRDKMGQFLLSGSSSPELLKQITETLAGSLLGQNLILFPAKYL